MISAAAERRRSRPSGSTFSPTPSTWSSDRFLPLSGFGTSRTGPTRSGTPCLPLRRCSLRLRSFRRRRNWNTPMFARGTSMRSRYPAWYPSPICRQRSPALSPHRPLRIRERSLLFRPTACGADSLFPAHQMERPEGSRIPVSQQLHAIERGFNEGMMLHRVPDSIPLRHGGYQISIRSDSSHGSDHYSLSISRDWCKSE